VAGHRCKQQQHRDHAAPDQQRLSGGACGGLAVTATNRPRHDCGHRYGGHRKDRRHESQAVGHKTNGREILGARQQVAREPLVGQPDTERERLLNQHRHRQHQ